MEKDPVYVDLTPHHPPRGRGKPSPLSLAVILFHPFASFQVNFLRSPDEWSVRRVTYFIVLK